MSMGACGWGFMVASFILHCCGAAEMAVVILCYAKYVVSVVCDLCQCYEQIVDSVVCSVNPCDVQMVVSVVRV